MNIKVLEDIMRKYGLVIRAIPATVRSVYEKEHINDYPNGRIEYVPQCKREMAVFERPNKNAGKFMIAKVCHSCCCVQFDDKKYFDHIQDAVHYILGKNSNVEDSAVKFRVIDTRTNKDITADYSWVLQPSGRLCYNDYGDLIGLDYAKAIFEK